MEPERQRDHRRYWGLKATLLVLAGAVVSAAPAEAPVIHFDEVVKAHPIDPVRGAVLTEVARGEHASVNVWQMTKGLSAHFHREHGEVIIVKGGRAQVRVGDRTVLIQAGDTLLFRRLTPGSPRSARRVTS